MDELQNRAYQYFRQGRYESAIGIYQQAIEQFPEERENYWYLGLALLLDGKEEDAENFWLSVLLEATLEDWEIWWGELRDVLLREALTYQSSGYLSPAEIIYRKLLEQEQSSEIYYYLGTLLTDRGEFTESIFYYQEALRVDPNSGRVHNGLARSLSESGYFLEGYTHALTSLSIEPDNIQYRIWLAIILRNIYFNRADDGKIAYLLQCFETPGVNRQNLATATISIVKLDPNFQEIAASIEESPRETYLSLSRHPLLPHLLRDTLIADLTFERILTECRKRILLEAIEPGDCEDGQSFTCSFISSLALQCFNNEFIFIESDWEKEAIANLQDILETSEPSDVENIEINLAVFALYKPLYELNNIVKLDALDRKSWSRETCILWKREVNNYFEERALKQKIERITPIENTVSLAVQSQYEENPYPRWLGISALTAAPLSTFLKSSLPYFNPPEKWLDISLEILSAGCGTGAEAIYAAINLKNANVLAIDLSLTSLAYASRMAKELNVGQISFKQGDILGLGTLSRRFPLIFSSGVLHHLDNPIEGVRVLVDLLLPEGLLSIALYSARARYFITKTRQFIADRAYQNTAEDIKRCRQEIIDSQQSFARFMTSQYDFYSLSNCRDLIFHVNEHCFTIPEIQDLLARFGLRFLGFSSLSPQTKSDYQKMFPDDFYLNDLNCWNQFEEAYPNTFIGMYNMWCQKI